MAWKGTRYQTGPSLPGRVRAQSSGSGTSSAGPVVGKVAPSPSAVSAELMRSVGVATLATGDDAAWGWLCGGFGGVVCASAAVARVSCTSRAPKNASQQGRRREEVPAAARVRCKGMSAPILQDGGNPGARRQCAELPISQPAGLLRPDPT